MNLLKKTRKIIFIAVALLSLMFVCCNMGIEIENESSYSAIKDISRLLNRQSVNEMAFMGGSVLYSPETPESNQISKGVVIALRIGRVGKISLGSGEYAYRNDNADYQLGYINVNAVSQDSISLSYYSFDSNGNVNYQGDYSVAAGQSADLNKDGFNDIVWRKPDAGRKGIRNNMWLEFICDMRENDTAAMYSIIPMQYSRSTYPNGLIGINTQGRYVISKYDVGTSNRSLISSISYGDYVLDMEKNTVGRYIGAERNGSSARAIEDMELEIDQPISDESTAEDFEFKPNEFIEEFSVNELLGALPPSIVKEKFTGRSISENVAYLNIIIRDPNFLDRLLAENSGDAADEIKEQLRMTPLSGELERMLFTRHSLSLIYPDKCPDVSLISSSLCNALPWFYVRLGDNQLDAVSNKAARSAVSDYYENQMQKNYDEQLAQYRKEAVKKFQDHKGVYTDEFIEYEINREVITKYFSTLKSYNIAPFIVGLTGQQWLIDFVRGTNGELSLGVDGSISFANANPSIDLKVGILLKCEMENNLTISVNSTSIFSSVRPETLDVKDAKKAFDQQYPGGNLTDEEIKDWLESMQEDKILSDHGLDHWYFSWKESGKKTSSNGEIRPSVHAKNKHVAISPVKTLPFVITFDAQFDLLFKIKAVIELKDVMAGGLFMNVFHVKMGIDWGFRKYFWKIPVPSSFYADPYAVGKRYTESAGFIGFTKINKDNTYIGGGAQFVICPVVEGRIGLGLGFSIAGADADATVGGAVDIYAPLSLYFGVAMKPDLTPVIINEMAMDMGYAARVDLQLCLDPPVLSTRRWTWDVPGLKMNKRRQIFRVRTENFKCTALEGVGPWED